MTEKEKLVIQAEVLVRRVLTEKFQQKIPQETLRAVAEKVARSVSANKPQASV